ncbi:MAG: small-conductance mechanosensitive ion channel [Chloroflexota bacterium]|nr:small-conductance mechanosensitive ion channel [Chloroflexota bacterium]
MTVFNNFGEAVISALGHALDLVLVFVPLLLGFLLILLVGYIIATALSKAVTFLLRKIGFDNLANRIGLSRLEQNMGIRLDPAGVLGKIVFWFIFLVFLVPATNALGLTAVSGILNTMIAYIPNVFVAILVLFLGTLAATFVADIVRGATASANIGNPNLFANVARYAIIGFAALIALEQLQIAPALLNILFTAIIGALAIAFGLAFGLGGQDTARKWLNRGESTVTNAASKMQAQQSVNQASDARTQAQQTVAQQQAYQQQAYQQQAYPQQYDQTTQTPFNRPPTR